MPVIKLFYQLFQRKDLLVAGRTPSKKRHIIHHRLGHKSLLDQVFVRRMAAAFAQLFMIFICDQRTVHIHRHVPAKCFINFVVFRS